LNNYARSAFQSKKPQIGWCDAGESSRSYGQVAIVITIRTSYETALVQAVPAQASAKGRF